MCGEKCTPDQGISEYPFKISFVDRTRIAGSKDFTIESLLHLNFT